MTHENIQTIETTAPTKLLEHKPAPKKHQFPWSDATTEALVDLYEMLSYTRPRGSRSEKKFINRYLMPLGVTVDECGNLIKVIGVSQVVWSCHTDTVHSKSGRQELAILGEDIKLRHNSKSNCLGADCTTGVWIMREMIKAGVKGTYIFHFGEECGGIGSSHIARHTPEVVASNLFAIAFDRYGTTSIITHQFGGRCCSDTFAHSLDKALGGGFECDTGGSFTDTANYTDLIGECTNISVGYYNQHGRTEKQNIPHAAKLREIMIKFDESLLVSHRKPGEKEKWRGYGVQRSFGRSGWDSALGDTWDDDYDQWARFDARNDDKNTTTASRVYVPERKGIVTPADDDEVWEDGLHSFSTRKSRLIGSNRDFIKLIEDNPEGVADFLEHHGIDEDEVVEWIMQSTGVLHHRGSKR